MDAAAPSRHNDNRERVTHALAFGRRAATLHDSSASKTASASSRGGSAAAFRSAGERVQSRDRFVDEQSAVRHEAFAHGLAWQQITVI